MKIKAEPVPEYGAVDLFIAEIFRSNITGKPVIQVEVISINDELALLELFPCLSFGIWCETLHYGMIHTKVKRKLVIGFYILRGVMRVADNKASEHTDSLFL